MTLEGRAQYQAGEVQSPGVGGSQLAVIETLSNGPENSSDHFSNAQELGSTRIVNPSPVPLSSTGTPVSDTATTQGRNASEKSVPGLPKGLNTAFQLHQSSDTHEERNNGIVSNTNSGSPGISSHIAVTDADDLMAVNQSSSGPPASGLDIFQSQNRSSVSMPCVESSALDHSFARVASLPNQTPSFLDSPEYSTLNSTSTPLNMPSNGPHFSEISSVLQSPPTPLIHSQDLEGGNSSTSSTIQSSQTALKRSPRVPFEEPFSSQLINRKIPSSLTNSDDAKLLLRVADLERFNSQIIKRVQHLERMVRE